MSQSAQVRSLEQLERFQAALARFGIDGAASLAAADLEIRRVHDALEDRLRWWKHQTDKRREEMAQARSALSHARAMHEGKNIGCVEQELALRKCQERLREAEAKVATVKRWQRELPTFLKDFEGPARGLAGFLEADLRQGVVQLAGKIDSLKAYVAVAGPEARSSK